MAIFLFRKCFVAERLGSARVVFVVLVVIVVFVGVVDGVVELGPINDNLYRKKRERNETYFKLVKDKKNLG